jgi:hypothetical protein
MNLFLKYLVLQANINAQKTNRTQTFSPAYNKNFGKTGMERRLRRKKKKLLGKGEPLFETRNKEKMKAYNQISLVA